MRQEQRTPNAEAGTGRRWSFFGRAFGILFALTSLWALASPLMSSPDEPAHAMRAAAVVRGDLTGVQSASEPGTTDVTAPRYLADANSTLACFRGQILASAACQDFDRPDPDRLVTAHTTAGSNTPVFYLLVGWPSLVLSEQAALYAMRAISAAICSALLAATLMAVRGLSSSPWALIAVSVTITPMTLFLSGTLNPNGIEVCAAAATFALLLLVFRTPSPGRLLWERVGLITVAASLLSTTRTIALLWLLVIVLTALALARDRHTLDTFRRLPSWLGVSVIALSAVGSLVYFAVSPKGLVLSYTPVGAGSTWSQGFLTTLDKTLEYGIGWIGHFGWLDTPAPAFVLIVFAMTAGVLLIIALLVGSARERIALALVVGTMVLVPPITQAAVVSEVGYIWQGRYTLAMFVVLLLASGIVIDGRVRVPDRLITRRLVDTTLLLVAVAHLTSFLWALKRYVSSLSWDKTWVDMLLRPDWVPPLGVVPLVAVFTVTLALGAWGMRRTIDAVLPLGEESVGPPAQLAGPTTDHTGWTRSRSTSPRPRP